MKRIIKSRLDDHVLDLYDRVDDVKKEIQKLLNKHGKINEVEYSKLISKYGDEKMLQTLVNSSIDNYANIRKKAKKFATMIKDKYVGVLKQWEQDHPTWFLNENETENYTQLTSQIMSSVDNDKCRIEISKLVYLP